MISAIVLTKNEAQNIKPCLKSLKWCDEVLVIDDYSTDNTVKIASKLGARTVKHHLNNNFASQRNFGLKKAKGDWVLFIDADERVNKALASEINHCTKTTKVHQGYLIRRDDYFMGKKLNFGETANIKLLRLARKRAGQWIRPVHETWSVTGKTALLKQPLRHYPHANLKAFLNSINYYSEIEASLRIKQKPARWKVVLELLTFPFAKFLKNYFFLLGILDGFPGLVMAAMMSYHSLLVRVKTYEKLT